METKDHLHLAKLITEKIPFGTTIERTAFEYGCITPDINPLTYIKGHTYSGTIGNVKRVIEKLHGKLKGPADYFHLGRAIHFIGDYFTFPHTPLFQGTLSEHRTYESNLHKYIAEQGGLNDDIISKNINDATDCINFIEKLQEKYHNIKHSIASDWLYVRLACSNVAFSSAKSKIAVPKVGVPVHTPIL